MRCTSSVVGIRYGCTPIDSTLIHRMHILQAIGVPSSSVPGGADSACPIPTHRYTISRCLRTLPTIGAIGVMVVSIPSLGSFHLPFGYHRRLRTDRKSVV